MKLDLPKVEDIKVDKNKKVSELIVDFYKSGGFQAKHLANACFILEEMIKDKKCTKFLSFPACIIATGTRGIIVEFLKRKWFDIVITTCGTLDHDIARVVADYYHGTFFADDKELAKEGIHRLGNVFVPLESYGIAIENFMKKLLNELYDSGKRVLATYELVWEIGKFIEKNYPEKKEESICYWAYKNKTYVFIPGISDGAVGCQIWLFRQRKSDFYVDIWGDEDKLASIVFDSEKTGALIIGGGISKHHTIWWNQFKEGLDYAVYITTAVEWDGSLSGAQTREAISWRKISEKAKHVTVYGDATILLPLIACYLLDRISDEEA